MTKEIKSLIEFTLPQATETCWHCDYPRAEEFRYCPNCGIWLMKAYPIRVIRTIHGGNVVGRIDARGT